VNEIAGVGNHNTAKFWEYDTRLGRRWNLDPVETDGVSQYVTNSNDPINNYDPEGDCPWCVGALVGGLVDAGLQLAEIGMTDKTLSDFNVKSVFVSAAAGAIGVGIATKVDKMIKVANVARRAAAVIKVSTSAATDATTSATGQYIKEGKVSARKVVIDVIAGGVIGNKSGDIAKESASQSAKGRVLAKQADRARRIANNSARAGRQKAAAKAEQKAYDHAARRGAAAGTVGSGVSGDVADKLTKPNPEPSNSQAAPTPNENKHVILPTNY
jgi:hypothetical protein